MLQENFREKDFVYCYRSFSNPKSATHLTEEEFYLYVVLFTIRMKDNSMIINTLLLEDMMYVPFDNRPSRNRGKIREILVNLINKNVLLSHCDTLNNKENCDISNSCTFRLSINESYLKHEENWSGFVQLPFSELNKFNSIKGLYIYFSILSREIEGTEVKISFSEWGKILRVSNKTAVSYIDIYCIDEDEYGAKSNAYSFVKKGGYLDRDNKIRETNSYSTTPYDTNSQPIIRKAEQTKLIKTVDSANNTLKKFNRSSHHPF